MIFPCIEVTALVLDWQQTRSQEVLVRILEKTNALIEAVVSGYNPVDRDDMIQEVRARIIYALPHFDHNISNLYNYFAAVIHNCCVTYNIRAWKHDCEDIDSRIYDTSEDKYDESEILEDLVVRNRVRFPSIDVLCIDKSSKLVHDGLINSESSRTIINRIVEECVVERKIAAVIYQSSVVYLRARYSSYAEPSDPEAGEFSIMLDIRELVGVDNYIRLQGACRKLSIRIL
jgi:hypothetical protein